MAMQGMLASSREHYTSKCESALLRQPESQ
jgi:hypothetical protein